MSHKFFRPIIVLILVSGLMAIQTPQPARAAGLWYVSTTGDDNNDCLSTSAPCATINGAIGKATAGDMVFVAVGTYTSSGTEVVLIDRDITLSGGWDETFTAQSQTSFIDGGGARTGIVVMLSSPRVVTTVENFTIQNGYGTYGSPTVGGGIVSDGNLTLSNSTVQNNQASYGGGIYNSQTTSVNNSTISNNTSDGTGGGIYNDGTLTLNNSTVSGNTSLGGGGGIRNTHFSDIGTLILKNSTLSGNTGAGGGGISNINGDIVILENSILAGNTTTSQFGQDCDGSLNSSGYNILGSITDCTVTATTGDQFDVDPLLGQLQDNGGPTFTHALLLGSPAIDAGNPAGCTDQDGNLLTTDQRGVARPQGVACDIGAFEFETGGGGGETIQVTIDIKPGNKHNKINPKSKERIQVAILSTPDFDAFAMVDKSTLTFGRTGEEDSLASCKKKPKDVNRDKLPDLVCDFYIRASGFQPGDTIGILKGMTLEGNAFTGQDAVKIQKVHQRPDDDDD